MAKKKSKRDVNDNLLNASQGKGSDSCLPDMKSLEKMSDMALDSLSDADKGRFLLMYTLASTGVTPEEYARLYDIYQASTVLAEGFSSNFEDDDDSFPYSGRMFGRKRCEVKEYSPLKNADESTLVLKIQMQGVTKPPMWREVEIPANFNFLELHEVIQEVMGFDDCHLWQFNVKAFDDSLLIGIEMDRENPFGPGLDEVTHDAVETPVTQFLQQKGDKLEYVYDFGDDWIFVVEVKDLAPRKIEHPVCRKYKSDLNAIEDFGGVWAYMEARQDLEEWSNYSKKRKKERLEYTGFDSEKEYLDFLNDCRINLDDLNDSLMSI